jgi:hypothetical protein
MFVIVKEGSFAGTNRVRDRGGGDLSLALPAVCAGSGILGAICHNYVRGA